jgi:hypothetical protein
MPGQRRGHQKRAAGHHRALVAAVDPASHRIGAHAFGQQGQAEGQRGLRAGQPQLLLHRREQQGEGVEDAAPGDQLRQRQPENQPAVVACGRGHALRSVSGMARIVAAGSAAAQDLDPVRRFQHAPSHYRQVGELPHVGPRQGSDVQPLQQRAAQGEHPAAQAVADGASASVACGIYR